MSTIHPSHLDSGVTVNRAAQPVGRGALPGAAGGLRTPGFRANQPQRMAAAQAHPRPVRAGVLTCGRRDVESSASRTTPIPRRQHP